MVTGITRVARRWGLPVLVGLIAFVAAYLALLPGVDFWDTGELQTVGPVMGTAHPTGYPTYVVLGWIASVLLQGLGEPAWRMNVFAAICLAVAAGVTTDLARVLTRSWPLGVAAGVGLGLAQSVWYLGTHAEAHILHVAFVAVLLRLLVAWEDGRRDRTLIAAAVVFGLSVGNHSLTLLLVPAVALFVLAVEPGIWRRPTLIVACLAAVTITTAAIFLELPLRAGPFRAPLVYGTPQTWDGFWYIVLAQQFQDAFRSPFVDLAASGRELLQRAWAGFGPLAIVLPLAFIATAVRRPRYALLTGVAFVTTVVFAITYVNADINRYYTGPTLIGWTWLAILGAVAVDAIRRAIDPLGFEIERTGWTAPDPASPARRRRPGTRTAIALVIAAVLLVPTVVLLPRTYASVDHSADHRAQRWLDKTLARLEPDAVVLSWWSYSTPLWYAQHIDGQRPDVEILDDRTRLDEGLGELEDVIDANLGTRPVYVLRADPRESARLLARYRLQLVDPTDGSGLSQVLGRLGTGS
jgi:hypothetical protein